MDEQGCRHQSLYIIWYFHLTCLWIQHFDYNVILFGNKVDITVDHGIDKPGTLYKNIQVYKLEDLSNVLEDQASFDF